jgi:hypothetical protein
MQVPRSRGAAGAATSENLDVLHLLTSASGAKPDISGLGEGSAICKIAFIPAD